MLLSKVDVLKLLRCPKSGAPLKTINNKMIAELSDGDIEYEIIDGYPILIDFENSVLRRGDIETLSSVVERRSYTGFLGMAKKLVSSSDSVTEGNVEKIIELLLGNKDRARILIVGGGSKGNGMDPFYQDSRIEVVSFDIYASPLVQFIADAHNIPFSDNGFDGVIIQAVLEHVLEPDRVVSEIYRVLKKDGIVYSETPFLQNVHEGAYGFTRYTESGHRYLFRRFELIESGVVAGAGTQLLWSLDYFFRSLFRSRKSGKVIKLFFFWLRYFDRLIPESYNIDSASGVYFLGKKQFSQINAKEVISHYKGAQ